MSELLEDASVKNDDNPLVTFALFSYNQEKYIREAVEGALAQTYSPLEIILSDDCSTDSTFQIIESVVSQYSGSHKIILNKNPLNLGLAKHFGKVIKRSQGEIVVLAAGDDISLPERTTRTVELLDTDKKASFVSFAITVIDAEGKVLGDLNNKASAKVHNVSLSDYLDGHSVDLSGVSRGIRKKIYDVFGDLNTSCPTEDSPYLLRGLMLGHALLSREVGVLYRRHDSNISGSGLSNSMNVDEIRLQYYADVNLAYSNKLIDDHLHVRLVNWIERTHRRRAIFTTIYFSKWNALYLFRNIIFGKDLSFSEKRLILCNVLFGRLKKFLIKCKPI